MMSFNIQKLSTALCCARGVGKFEFWMKYAMAKADLAEVTSVTRQHWAKLVSVAGARETAREAPVMRAMGVAFHRLSQGRSTAVVDAVTDAIRDTDEWAAVHRDTITSIFQSIAMRPPSDDELVELWSVGDADTLAERISDMQLDDVGSHIRCDEDRSDARDNGDTTMVDDAWMNAFENCYGRDPTVHEYIRLRPVGLNLSECARAHKECFVAMRDVYRQFYDRSLEEREFVKKYIPDAVIGQRPSLVDDERDRALQTDVYRDAMLSRLSQLYAIMSGDSLSDEEVVHLFSQRVKGNQLPLDTDELNTIVAEYVSVGESLRESIRKIFRTYLDRDAHTDEIDDWLPKFRMKPGASDSLKRDLASGHEFHSVIIDIISDANPQMSRRDRFRVLGDILQGHSSELQNLSSADDLISLIKQHCHTEA
jgi:hypothetical protein